MRDPDLPEAVMPDPDIRGPETRESGPTPDRRIDVTADGPYVVRGSVPLSRVEVVETEFGEPVGIREGEALATGRTYALCRCGRSATKPFCDRSHERVGFDGTETADRTARADRARVIHGRGIVVSDDKPLCTHAGFCANRTTDVWEMVRHSGDPEVRERMLRMVELCPSGRLASAAPAHEDGSREPAGEPSVLLERDGPIWVRGSVPIRAADGTTWEIRDRVTLCRCGASRNKPFCDDTHNEIGFRDGCDGSPG